MDHVDPIVDAAADQDDLAASPPADELAADDAAQDLVDEPQDEDDGIDDPEGIVITKAEYERLQAAEREREQVLLEKARIEREKDEAKRFSRLQSATQKAQKEIDLWVERGEAEGYTPEIINNIRGWERWLAGEHLRDRDERLDEMAYAVEYAARPNWARELVERNGLTETQAKRVLSRAKQDPAGAQALVEVFSEMNAEKARDHAKRSAAAKKAGKAKLEQAVTSRRQSGADSLGGSGQPSLTSRWKTMSSQEKLKALIYGNN